MLADLYEKIYVDGLPMKPVGLVLGILLILLHAWVLLKPDAARGFLKRFPRNYGLGVLLMALAGIWAWFLVSQMDLGEYFTLRRWGVLLTPILSIGTILYVKEFLSVRALGILLLLSAAVVLRSAFLKEPWIPKLLLPILAYAWVFKGLFYVGMPYLMRNGASWVSHNDGRLRLAGLLGLLYGIALVVVAFLYY